jgi:hypothetical protein
MRASSSTVIAAPVSIVFRFLTDEEAKAGLMPPTAIEATGGVIEQVENSRIVIREVAKEMTGLTTWTLTPANDATCLTITSEFQLRGPAAAIRTLLVGRQLESAIEHWIVAMLARLKARIEGRPEPPAPRVLSKQERRFLCYTLAGTAGVVALATELFLLSLPLPAVLGIMLAVYLAVYVLAATYAGGLLLMMMDVVRSPLAGVRRLMDWREGRDSNPGSGNTRSSA